MKKVFILLVMVMVLGFSIVASNAAPLRVIGTATYSGNAYNLIYDDDQGLIWLDYSKSQNIWDNQVTWVSGLNRAGVLTYNLNPGINVSWEGVWRLPSAGGNPQEGPNQTTSEMGHLHYISLGGTGGGTDQNPSLTNTDPFKNLVVNYYWSDTRYSDWDAWYFAYNYGNHSYGSKYNWNYAMAVRSAMVPEPGILVLLGISMMSIAGLSRKWRIDLIFHQRREKAGSIMGLAFFYNRK